MTTTPEQVRSALGRGLMAGASAASSLNPKNKLVEAIAVTVNHGTLEIPEGLSSVEIFDQSQLRQDTRIGDLATVGSLGCFLVVMRGK